MLEEKKLADGNYITAKDRTRVKSIPLRSLYTKNKLKPSKLVDTKRNYDDLKKIESLEKLINSCHRSDEQIEFKSFDLTKLTNTNCKKSSKEIAHQCVCTSEKYCVSRKTYIEDKCYQKIRGLRFSNSSFSQGPHKKKTIENCTSSIARKNTDGRHFEYAYNSIQHTGECTTKEMTIDAQRINHTIHNHKNKLLDAENTKQNNLYSSCELDSCIGAKINCDDIFFNKKFRHSNMLGLENTKYLKNTHAELQNKCNASQHRNSFVRMFSTTFQHNKKSYNKNPHQNQPKNSSECLSGEQDKVTNINAKTGGYCNTSIENASNQNEKQNINKGLIMKSFLMRRNKNSQKTTRKLEEKNKNKEYYENIFKRMNTCKRAKINTLELDNNINAATEVSPFSMPESKSKNDLLWSTHIQSSPSTLQMCIPNIDSNSNYTETELQNVWCINNQSATKSSIPALTRYNRSYQPDNVSKNIDTHYCNHFVESDKKSMRFLCQHCPIFLNDQPSSPKSTISEMIKTKTARHKRKVQFATKPLVKYNSSSKHGTVETYNTGRVIGLHLSSFLPSYSLFASFRKNVLAAASKLCGIVLDRHAFFVELISNFLPIALISGLYYFKKYLWKLNVIPRGLNAFLKTFLACCLLGSKFYQDDHVSNTEIANRFTIPRGEVDEAETRILRVIGYNAYIEDEDLLRMIIECSFFDTAEPVFHEMERMKQKHTQQYTFDAMLSYK